MNSNTCFIYPGSHPLMTSHHREIFLSNFQKNLVKRVKSFMENLQLFEWKRVKKYFFNLLKISLDILERRDFEDQPEEMKKD